MKKMTKARWAGIGRFVAEACRALEARGIAVAVKEPFDPKKVDGMFSIGAVAMTKFGRLDVSIHDWIHTRFELPKLASSGGIDCNPHSGKWNFHFRDELFEAKAPADGKQDYVKECVDMFAFYLDKVEAREWTPAPVVLTRVEVGERSEKHWETRKAFGDDLSIEGFAREEAKDWLAEQWVLADGTTSTVEMNRVMLDRYDDVEVFFMLKSFRERNPEVGMPDFYGLELAYTA